MPRAAIAALLAATVTLLPAAALAQAALPAKVPAAINARASGGGEDEVTLKNGGMLRGTVVALEPGQMVVIVVGGAGEPRTIAWEEVDKVQRGKYVAGAAVAAPADVGSAPQAGPSPGVGAPRLHIDSDSPAVGLQEISASMGVVNSYGGSAYGIVAQTVCQAPCDQVVDGRSGREFFVAGNGVPPSSSFQIHRMSGDVTITVNAGSHAMRWGGRFFTSVGLTGVVVGSLFLARGDTVKDGTTIGRVLLGTGIGVLAGGIVMWAKSTTTIKFSGPGVPAEAAKGWAPKVASLATTGGFVF